MSHTKVGPFVQGAAPALNAGNMNILDAQYDDAMADVAAGYVAKSAVADVPLVSPTLTGISLGNGTLAANYSKVGKRLFCEIQIVIGSTTTISGAITIATLLTLVSTRIPADAIMVKSSSGATYQGMAHVTSAGLVTVGVMSLTDRSIQPLSSTVPFTSAAGDSIAVSFTSDTP